MLDQVLVYPLINILVAMYQGLHFLHIPYALGFAIILLSILIRLAMYPMMGSQLKVSKKMQELAPHIKNLKERHKGDNARIQKETMLLYKEHGVNPASGCVSAIIQMGIIIGGLYPAFTKVISLEPARAIAEINNKIIYTDALRITQPWDTHFFGLPLGKSPSDLISLLPIVFIVPVLTALFQFIQSKMMFYPPAKEETTALTLIGKDEPKKSSADDFASAFQSQSMYLFPAMIALSSYTFPIGLSLYWNTFTVFGILQQYQIGGWGSLHTLAIWKKKTHK